MDILTVTWQSYDSLTADYPGLNLDDLNYGPLIKEKMRWPDYLVGYSSEWHPYVEAIRQSIIKNEVWAGGDWHQYSTKGAPVVAENHFMRCSFRSWGSLLAAIWSSELDRDFSYLDFYTDAGLPVK